MEREPLVFCGRVLSVNYGKSIRLPYAFCGTFPTDGPAVAMASCVGHEGWQSRDGVVSRLNQANREGLT